MGPLIRGHEADAPCRRVVEIRTELQTVCQFQTAPPDGHTDHLMRDGCPFYGALPTMSHCCRECAPRHIDHARPVSVPWQAWSLRRGPRVARQKVRRHAGVVDDCRATRPFRGDIASCRQGALGAALSARIARGGASPARCRHGRRGCRRGRIRRPDPSEPAGGCRTSCGRATRLPSRCDMSATATTRSGAAVGRRHAPRRRAERPGPASGVPHRPRPELPSK